MQINPSIIAVSIISQYSKNNNNAKRKYCENDRSATC